MEIEKTREELGQTVEALAAKTDVTGRAKEKASALKDQVTAQAQVVKDQLAAKTAGARDSVLANAGPAREQVAKASSTVSDATPEQVRKAAAAAGQRKGQILAVTGAVLAALWLLIRRRRQS